MRYHCGKELPPDARFCPHCGQPLAASTESAPVASPSTPDLAHFPAIVALPLRDYFGESNPLLKLYRLCDAVEIVTRFCTVVAVGELRGLHGGDLPDSVIEELRGKVESPTLGKWVGMLRALVREIDREPVVVPELIGFVRDDLFALVSGDPKDDEPTSPRNCFVDLRNHLVHGGAITVSYAHEMLEGWSAKLERLLPRLDFWRRSKLCWFDGDRARVLATDDRPGEEVPLSADLKLALSQKNLPHHVVLLRDGRWVDLWPLSLYAEPRMPRLGIKQTQPDPAPLLFVRAERSRLLYAALGAELPYGESSAETLLSGFGDLFRLNDRPKAERAEFDYAEEVKRDAARVVGRKAEFKHLKRSINAIESGVLWLSGPGGMGKSLLMSKIALNLPHDREAGDCLLVFWRFRASDAGRCNSHALYRHAIGQLCRWKPLDSAHIRPSADPTRLLSQLLDLLGKAAALTTPEGETRAPRVIFLLDGMDEIARSEPSFLEMPFSHPFARVVWVCAGRPDEATTRTYRPGREGCTAIYPDGLPSMSPDDIRAMLLDQHGRAKYDFLRLEERTRDELVTAIERKSEGLPLYVHFLLEDVAVGEKRFDAGLLNRLPDGLSRYYSELLNRFKLGAVAGLLPPLMATIAWSEEPLDESALLEFMRRREAVSVLDATSARTRLAEGLAALGGIVRGAVRRDGKVGYEPYHLTFRDYYRSDPDRIILDQNDNARAAFAKWATEWNCFERGTTAREYVLRHGAKHLLDLGRSEALYGLGRSEAFLGAQGAELVSEPQAPLRTLMAALQAACDNDRAVEMADFTLRHAQRKEEINRESPLQTLREGNLDRAIALCEQLEPVQQARKLLLLWCELLDASRTEDAERIEQLFQSKTWPPLPDRDRQHLLACVWRIATQANFRLARWCPQLLNAKVLGKLVQNLLGSNHREAARSVAESIENASLRSRASESVAIEFAKAGQFDDARCVADSIIEPAYRSAALQRIGAELARSDRLDDAIQVANEIKDPLFRSSLLFVIAVGFARSGEVEAARRYFEKGWELIDSIPSAYDRCRVLGERAIALVAAGRADEVRQCFDDAFQTAESIKVPSSRFGAMERLAIAHLRIGQIDHAQRVANSITDPEYQIGFLHELARSLVRAGRFDDARRAADRIESSLYSCRTLSVVATAMLRAGNVDEARRCFGLARQTAHLIPEKKTVSRSLREIAETLLHAGQFDQARGYFDEARKAAKAIDSELYRADAFIAIAVALAQGGRVHEARQVVDSIDNLGSQATALRDLAVVLVGAGRFRDAWSCLDEADGMASDTSAVDRQLISRTMSLSLAKLGHFDEAMQFVAGIEDGDGWRSHALKEIALAFAEIGKLDQAYRTAHSLELGASGFEAQIEIGVALAHANRFDEACACFNQAHQYIVAIEEDHWKPRYLADFAVALTRANRPNEARRCFAEACRIARSIEGAYLRTSVYNDLGIAHARLGQPDEARECFDRSGLIAISTDGPRQRSELWGELASALAQAGRFDEALRTTKSIGNSDLRSRATNLIVAKLADAGRVEEAEQIYFSSNREDPAGPLQAIAVGYARSGRVDEALRLADSIREPSHRAATLGSIAVALIQTRDEASIPLQWVRDLCDSVLVQAPEVLFSIAVAFADRRCREGFKMVLPFCAGKPDSGIKVMAALLQIYPEEATSIASMLRELTRSGSVMASNE